MADITKALNLDELASKDSPIHRLDGRIKLISTVFIIVIAAFSNNIFKKYKKINFSIKWISYKIFLKILLIKM